MEGSVGGGHDTGRSNGSGNNSSRMDLLKPEMPSQRIRSEDII